MRNSQESPFKPANILILLYKIILNRELRLLLNIGCHKTKPVFLNIFEFAPKLKAFITRRISI